MNRGVPPTARNARTGEFTPPGITAWARSNRAAEAGASDTASSLAASSRSGFPAWLTLARAPRGASAGKRDQPSRQVAAHRDARGDGVQSEFGLALAQPLQARGRLGARDEP